MAEQAVNYFDYYRLHQIDNTCVFFHLHAPVLLGSESFCTLLSIAAIKDMAHSQTIFENILIGFFLLQTKNKSRKTIHSRYPDGKLRIRLVEFNLKLRI